MKSDGNNTDLHDITEILLKVGHQAKNRKKGGDEIKKNSSPLKLLRPFPGKNIW
jgi:hypothetical protein